MKKLIAVAVAGAMMAPLAVQAENMPDNVGTVTYMGNIVANSPMWQWTVNDYPGGRLDTKPSTATTANGVTTYPLAGQAFIAVSGYLPSLVGINIASGESTTLGIRDITTLTDQAGNAIANVTDAQKGAVTFTIAASALGADGGEVTGTLKLKSTELRGARFAYTSNYATKPTKSQKSILLAGGTRVELPTQAGSCFSGTGSYSSKSDVISGTGTSPSAGSQSATAFSAFLTALTSADASGAAPSWVSLTGYSEDSASGWGATCMGPTALSFAISSSTTKVDYLSAAHIMELTPVELAFSTPVQGTWSSTLTVTAYQM
ncbi:hypothetical protein Q4R69_17145 [Morganella morganii subsp. sibonii]